MDKERLKRILANDGHDDSIFFENPSYDTAIIGITDNGQVCYSYNKMVDYLVDNDGMTEEEAIEFIDYNTVRAIPYFASHGNVPVIVYDYY